MEIESVISQKPKLINDGAKNCLDILIGGESAANAHLKSKALKLSHDENRPSAWNFCHPKLRLMTTLITP